MTSATFTGAAFTGATLTAALRSLCLTEMFRINLPTCTKPKASKYTLKKTTSPSPI
ncbi:hypothetical protein ACFL2G_02915 [Candidatus Omnitrophota bacterium]